MSSKDSKAPEAKDEPKVEAKVEAKAEAKVEPKPKANATPEVKALAEKIFIQSCMVQRQGFTPEHNVKMAHEYAAKFLAYDPE